MERFPRMAKDKDIKTALLDAAQEVFSRKGVATSTLEDVAKEAKVDARQAKAAFGNLDSLVAELIGRDIDQTSDLFTKVINDRGKADIKLARLVRELLTRYQKSYALFNVASAGFEEEAEDEAQLKKRLAPEHVDRYRQNTAILGRLVAQGQSENLFSDVDPLEAAYILRGMIGAAIKYRRLAKKTDDMRNHADVIMRVFLKGLLR